VIEEGAPARERMVDEQLVQRGIRDPRVLAAMRKVPRDRFVDAAQRARAYEDTPLPIAGGQTISQPYMVARMLELLRLDGSERVLEIGAGSGYQTALLCELARQVFAVERVAVLAETAARRLDELGYRCAEVGAFDGTYGWRERAPFDAIVVAAAAPGIPALLVDQLAVGGRMVIPVGTREQQRLAIVTRVDEKDYRTEWETPCSFVPLVGRFGWGGEGPPQA
jgi:protein-L-isoaspartate(D-aspartate) O-methyltransferase